MGIELTKKTKGIELRFDDLERGKPYVLAKKADNSWNLNEVVMKTEYADDGVYLTSLKDGLMTKGEDVTDNFIFRNLASDEEVRIGND